MKKSLLAFNLLVFALLGMFIYGCAAGPNEGINPSPSVTTTTIYGRITDEAGLPVAAANLTAGTSVATTDINGFFIMKNATVPAGRALVIAKKSGYFSAAHAEVPNAKGTRIDLHMMSDAATATLSATTGGLVNAQGGGTVNFAAGSFTDASGNSYIGQVKVAARFLDPKNPNFFDFFDGDMMAQQADGSGASLISCGVLRVELKDASGNTLKLDPAKPATLNFPKPLDTKAPATMPLWYFDESLGMWKESGSATLTGGMYTGTVTHFSDFNLDYHDSTGGYNTTGTVSLRIVCNSVPIGGVTISIVGDDAPGKYFVHPGGKTGSDGRITFIRFPANRPVQITVRSDKNGGLYFLNNPQTLTIAPGDVKDLGDISLDSPCPASISGSLTDCNGTKIEGLVSITNGSNVIYNYTTTGDFAVQAPAGVALSLDAIDANGNQAQTVTIPTLASGEQRAIGSVKICGGASANYIDITLPGSGNKEGNTIALSPDGSHVALCSSTQITVYDTKSGAQLSTITTTTQSYYAQMQFSTDNTKLLVSSVYSGAAVLYDVSKAAATQIVSIPTVNTAKLYDDGSKIIGIKNNYPNASVINVYSATDGSVISTVHPAITGSSDSMGYFGLIRDENSVIYPDQTSGNDIVWGVASDTKLRNFPVSGTEYTFSVSEDGLTVASSADNATYSCYDTKTGLKIGAVNTSGTNGNRSGNPVLTKNFAYISDQVSGATVVRIIKIADGTSTTKLLSGTVSTYVSSLAASRQENFLAAVNNGIIRVWKLQ